MIPAPGSTAQQDSDAVDSIASMLTGSQMLQDQPGVLYGLEVAQARPQDAQAVDQFLRALDAEKQVQIASAAGAHISLSSQQQAMLQGMGVDYSGVQYNYSSAVHDAASAFESQAGVTVQRDAQGNPILNDKGQFQVAPQHHSRGFFGGLWHDFTNDVVSPVYRDAIKPVLNVASKGYNFVSTQASDWFHQNTSGLSGGAEDTIHAQTSRTADMQTQGYDPSSFWSNLAFDSSGKAHSDLTPLSNQWDEQNPNGLYGWTGSQAVAEATKFLDNPKAYEKAIENDPTLSPQQVADKLKAVSSPQFTKLARQVGAKTASPGNDFANALGIDPVKHATTYALTAAGLNVAAAFVVDPLMLAGGVYKGVRLSQVGIDTLGDAAKAAKILDPTVSQGIQAQRLQARVQNFLDLTHQMGEAEAAGDTVKTSSLTARIAAQHKELAPLVPDVLGKNAITGFDKSGPVLGEAEPIQTLGDFANYIASKAALTRLMDSRAAVQSSLMPGAVSNFGLRLLQGKMAGWMTARSAARADLSHEAVLNAADADPAIASKLVHDGILTRLQPEADDAARLTDGSVIAAKADDAQQGLASAQRAHQFELTPAGKGDIAFNLRSQGTPLGTRTLGWATPTAIAARSRLAAQRFTTLLPRNTLIDINDAASSEKVFKLAMTYMNRGDANALRAAWNVGDGGTRKSIVHGLIDQLGHAAGLGKSASGQAVLDALKTKVESYSTVGDEITLDGDNLALHPGQVRTQWLLPTFRDLQRASAKVGLWEATLGRPLTSDQADTLMSQWKIGALFKPSTITRNQLEGWGRTALEGKAGAALQAKAYATARNKERWAAGLDDGVLDSYRAARGKVEGLQKMLKDTGLSREQRSNAFGQIADAKSTMADLEKTPRIQHLLATEAGDTKLAKLIENSSMLSGDELGRSAVGQHIADFAPFALAGRAYRRITGKFMDERTVAALDTLGKEDLEEAQRGFANQMLDADLGMRRAARESTEVAEAGFGPSILRRGLHQAYADIAKPLKPVDGKVVSWTQHDTDGINGATRYANALAQRVNPAPSVARAVLDRIEDPQNHTIDHVVQALDDPAIRKQMQLTAWGKVFWEDPTGPALHATTPAEVLIGKQEWAQKVVNDFHYLLTGQNGEYSQDIADYIRETGKAPDAPWIADNLEGVKRPAGVLAPEVDAIPSGGKQGLLNALMDVEGAGYKWMVERVLQRTTSSPVFLANYAEARAGLNQVVDHMIEQGVAPEAANSLAKELAIRNAWIKGETMIDDPGQKSQFDIVARNLFPFSRATQAMIRRWGGALWQDPIKAQKMMLAYEGAVHSGFVYTNTYGEPTFVYPGSGVMNMAMRELSKVPGFQSLAHFPVSASMTGGVLMSVPGADNPFRMSAGPMVMIPLREVAKLLPGHDRLIFDEIDSALNGPIGQGQTFGTLVPTAARRFYQALSTDDRNSAMASSMVGAIANLSAAGRLPAQDATPAQRQAFLNEVRSQTRSQLFLRAAFGLFAPASPSQPSEGTDASQADYAFHVRGMGQLSDEYKQVLNDVGGDLARANAIWTALHPDKTVYEIGRTQATASKVFLPATTQALEWMNTNAGFVHKYGSVAAYFLPESSSKEPFSDQAYKTQIELGLRQRKTPDEFLNDVYVRHAESIFYPAVADFDARIKAAKDSGDTSTANQWTQAKSQWETQFKALNPMFQKKIDSYGDARAMALGQLQNLRQMLHDGDVPDGQAPVLQSLISAYDGFEQFANEHKGSDQGSIALRDGARAMFDQWVQEKIAGGPLADLYSGVFRVLDTNFAKIAQNGGN